MTEINYMTQGNVQMPRLNTEAVQQWIVEVAQSHGQRVGCLTYVFCDDEYILATNREFLGHDYYTDIITFDYTNSRHIAWSSRLTRLPAMLRCWVHLIRPNSCASSSMACCTCAVSMIRVLESAKSWKNMKMTHSRFCLKTCLLHEKRL